jgi:midasin (ATPase involved in ribosome maturation)
MKKSKPTQPNIESDKMTKEATAKKPETDNDAFLRLVDETIPDAPTVAAETPFTGEPLDSLEADTELFHEAFDVVYRAVQCGPVCLVGPAGAGKTTIAEQVAKKMGLRFYFNGAIASEYKLMGFIDAMGRVVSTAFRKAWMEGGLYLFDEIDGSLPQAVLAFNNALANGTCDFPDGNYPRHPNFRVMAAANTYGHGADRVYVGRNQLDAASLDRFIFITMGYDEVMEITMAQDKDWVENVQLARMAVGLLKLRYIVSPRATIYGSGLIKQGMSIEQAEEYAIFKGMPPEDKANVRRKMIDIATKGLKEKPKTVV